MQSLQHQCEQGALRDRVLPGSGADLLPVAAIQRIRHQLALHLQRTADREGPEVVQELYDWQTTLHGGVIQGRGADRMNVVKHRSARTAGIQGRFETLACVTVVKQSPCLLQLGGGVFSGPFRAVKLAPRHVMPGRKIRVDLVRDQFLPASEEVAVEDMQQGAG